MEFKRERYLESLRARQHNGLIKVITGARRVGKSYILNELFYRILLKDGVPENHIIRFAFDSDDKLVITNSIGDLEFYEEVTLNEEGTLQYEVFKYIPVYKDGKPLIDEFGRKVYEQLKDENGTPVFDKNGSPVYKRDIILKADENTLDEVVNNYVVANNAEEFKLFFPEVYSKDFFKDYSNIR